MFVCDKCGCCCRNLDKSEIYSELDRGDGSCKYLEEICAQYMISDHYYAELMSVMRNFLKT